MIKFENTDVMNFDNAIRGARNPMNSWEKSDSELIVLPSGHYEYRLGENDLKLAQSLIKAGSDHRKFMRQIFVSVDITAPLYWWKEFDTYKVGTVANSCSTMHKIHDKEFTENDFSIEHLNTGNYLAFVNVVIPSLNEDRERFLKTKEKGDWWQMIQMLPSSYNQRRTITMNYENILNMYHARKNHKLDEWREGFTTWVSALPYAKELIMEVKE